MVKTYEKRKLTIISLGVPMFFRSEGTIQQTRSGLKAKAGNGGFCFGGLGACHQQAASATAEALLDKFE